MVRCILAVKKIWIFYVFIYTYMYLRDAGEIQKGFRLTRICNFLKIPIGWYQSGLEALRGDVLSCAFSLWIKMVSSTSQPVLEISDLGFVTSLSPPPSYCLSPFSLKHRRTCCCNCFYVVLLLLLFCLFIISCLFFHGPDCSFFLTLFIAFHLIFRSIGRLSTQYFINVSS